MIEKTFNKQQKVCAIRDFPYGCGTQCTNNEVIAVRRSEMQHSCVGVTDDQDYYHRPARSVDRCGEVDEVMKKAGFSLAANGSNVGKGRFVWAKRKLPPSCGSKVKPLSSEESINLIASQSRRRQVSESSRKLWLQNQRDSPEKKKKKKKKKLSYASALRAKRTHQDGHERRSNQLALVPVPVTQRNKITKALLSPREKVLKALRIFKLVFQELDRDKAARRGEAKTDTSHVTRTILKSEGMQVNAGKMIGPVPGIQVGDEFQYKSELSLIGLHFDIMGGIDYMDRGDMKLATSIVSSEGNGYIDIFDSHVMIYSGQGGNLKSKDHHVIEDQKLVTGNLALSNNIKAKTPVRVIRGKKRLDQRGKRYTYLGLYLVEHYWQEKGPLGNVLFKFKLRRVSGQPTIDLRHL